MKKSIFIEVKGISKFFGDVAVLDDVSFEIERGEMVALIGPNGSGKTTLARIIMGLVQPSSGEVFIDGKIPERVRRNIAYVPQRFIFDRAIPITVEEFMEFALVVARVPLRQRKLLIVERLKDVGMNGKSGALVSTLSGGQLQRVMIARALLNKKELLVLDEPGAGIDIEGQATIYELIREINEKYGTTCIMISHELDVVYRYATNVVCINKKKLCYGVPRKALTQKVLEEMYGKEVAHFHHEHRGKNKE